MINNVERSCRRELRARVAYYTQNVKNFNSVRIWFKKKLTIAEIYVS